MRLGAEQMRAASMTGTPVRVVAGAGTGKTAVIAERFRQLVAGGASPALAHQLRLDAETVLRRLNDLNLGRKVTSLRVRIGRPTP